MTLATPCRLLVLSAVVCLAAPCSRSTGRSPTPDASSPPEPLDAADGDATGSPIDVGGPSADDGGPEAPPAASRPDRQQVLAALVRVVFRPAYAELLASAKPLAAALVALRQAPSPAALSEARQAWRSVRASWRRTNAFGIGPGDDLGITGGIIDEPTSGERLEALIAGTTLLDTTALRSLPANVRGLLAIEHLLFEPGATDAAVVLRIQSDASGRRALYLELLGSDLETKLAGIAEAWGRFGTEIEQAGRGSVVFSRERDAYDALLNKALAITDRTIDILRQAAGGPVAHAALPITRRSDNVLADLLDDTAGLEALYAGRSKAGAAMPSLAHVARDLNPAADAEMQRALSEALLALQAVPHPLANGALMSAPVVRAIAALRAVKAALVTGIFSALGISVGFSDNDGD